MVAKAPRKLRLQFEKAERELDKARRAGEQGAVSACLLARAKAYQAIDSSYTAPELFHRVEGDTQAALQTATDSIQEATRQAMAKLKESITAAHSNCLLGGGVEGAGSASVEAAADVHAAEDGEGVPTRKKRKRKLTDGAAAPPVAPSSEGRRQKYLQATSNGHDSDGADVDKALKKAAKTVQEKKMEAEGTAELLKRKEKDCLSRATKGKWEYLTAAVSALHGDLEKHGKTMKVNAKAASKVKIELMQAVAVTISEYEEVMADVNVFLG